MILMLWLLLETTLLLDVCPKIYVIIFGNSYLSLRHQFALGSQVKESTEILVCLIFQDQVKRIAWVKKKIEDAEKMDQSHTEKCMKNALQNDIT